MSVVIARAPLRIDLAGAWKAAPLYARAFKSFAVNAAIDRYCYVVAEDSPDGGLYIESADLRLAERCVHGVLVEIGEPLQIVKAALEYFGDRGLYERGVSLFLSSQASPGAGLGASSAMAVALVRALAAYLGMAVSADQTAEIAGWLESERLGLPGGKEDHYVSASGGIRSARTSHGETAARLLAMPVAARDALSRSILLFHVPITSGVPEEASPDMEPGAVRALHELSCLAEEMESALGTGDLTMVGRLLEVSWEYRRRLLDPARAAELDRIYADASAAGAAGARLSGREMLLVFSPPERREHVRAALGGRGFREIRFGLTNEGARLLAGTATDPSTAREIVAERVYPQWTAPISSDRDRLRSS